MTVVTLPARSLRDRDAWRFDGRELRLLASCAVVAALGAWVTSHIGWPVLRLQVALATAGLAATFVLADRWAAEPRRIARGALLAALAGVASACVSLL